ncbi:hypothetical protein [Streptomyces sp. NPDC048057]|uniref:hypothetical protein n=1 Tax=Streptomyces sp. NPDC048057 TaxID=3155628 RepID=UPI0033FD8E21
MTAGRTADSEEWLAADIEEFAVHDRKGGWARALLIARRVEPHEGSGVGFEQESTKRFDRNTFRRISAREFARRSNSSAKRIMAFYQAWERAAADGIVDSAADLAPGGHVELPDEDEVPFFGEKGYYRSYEARMGPGERRQAIEAEAERAGVSPNGPVYVAQHPSAVKTAVVVDATTRTAAQEGIDEFNRRQEEADHADRYAARRAGQEREHDHDDAPGAGAGDERAEIEEAVRSTSRRRSESDVAMQVFTELTAVRLGTLKALSLLQQHSVNFSADRSSALVGLCEASEAAIAFIRDLATAGSTALNDDALRAFLDESEKLG